MIRDAIAMVSTETDKPNNLFAMAQQPLTLLLEDVEMLVGQVIADEFAPPLHAEGEEIVSLVRMAQFQWQCYEVGIQKKYISGASLASQP